MLGVLVCSPKALSKVNCPWIQNLVGAPNGGLLYYIDMMGATCAFPITYLFGPAVAYNCTLLVRIGLAGLGAQYFVEK